MKLVIVLCGRKRAGKTTLSKWFEASFDAKVLSVTAPIREITAKIWGLSERQVNGDQKDDSFDKAESNIVVDLPVFDHDHVTPRTLMIHTSKAIKSVLGDDVWIDRCLAEVEQSFERNNLIVIDGVRPHREVAAFRDLTQSGYRYISLGLTQVDPVAVFVVKVVCTDDAPADDEIDLELDQVEPDLTIRAVRDPEGRGQTLMFEATLALQELLTKYPKLIPLFDPGGDDVPEEAPEIHVNTVD